MGLRFGMQWRRTDRQESLPNDIDGGCPCCGARPKLSPNGKREIIEHDFAAHRGWRTALPDVNGGANSVIAPPARTSHYRDDS